MSTEAQSFFHILASMQSLPEWNYVTLKEHILSSPGLLLGCAFEIFGFLLASKMFCSQTIEWP